MRSFPNVEVGLSQISRDGGEQPLWAPNGRELFYVAPAGQLIAVPVQSGDDIAFGNPKIAITGPYWTRTLRAGREYDISPDGERFLMIKESAGGDSTEFILVQNWFEELKRLVPTDN